MIKLIFQTIATIVVFLLSYFEPIHGPVFIFFIFFILDFASGVFVSFKFGERFKSSKARWSFAKLLTYAGSFALLLFIGKELNSIGVGDHMPSFLYIIKMTVYVGIWFESKSIIENLSLIYPKNKYLSFLDYLLGVEFIKKIPQLADFLKQDKDKIKEKKDKDNN